MVDENQQMVIRMEKVNIAYIQQNVMMDFELTSWVHTKKLFLWYAIY